MNVPVSFLTGRLLVECRYVPGSALTVSYLVKTPTLGPAVQTQGVFGVQLRLAKGRQTDFLHPANTGMYGQYLQHLYCFQHVDECLKTYCFLICYSATDL